MNKSKMNTINLASPENRHQLSLEEIDVLTRKAHHWHDEEVLRFFTRFGRWVRDLLKIRGKGLSNKNEEFAEAKN